MPSPTCWLQGAGHAPRIPKLLTVNVASTAQVLEDLQDRAEEDAVMVNRVGGECEDAEQVCDGWPWMSPPRVGRPAIRWDAMRSDSRDAGAHPDLPGRDNGPGSA